MKSTAAYDPFVSRMMRRLWVPALCSAVGLSLGDVADALVIGNRMGETGLTAVSICLPLCMLINVLIYGLGTGGSIRYSRLQAEGKPEEAVRSFNHVLGGGIITAVILAALLCLGAPQFIRLLGAKPEEPAVYAAALTYGRLLAASIPLFVTAYVLQYYLIAAGQEKRAAFAFICGNAADLGLNILLVLVLDLGVAGAALSTAFGQLLSILLYLPGVLSKRSELRIRPVRIDFSETLRCFGTGFSTSVQYVGQFFFFMLVNRLLLASSGENGVAVFDVVQNTSYVIMYLCEAGVNALQPVVSTLHGEKNSSASRQAFSLSILLSALALALPILLVLLKPEWLCLLFGLRSPESLQIGRIALRAFAVSAPLGCLGILQSGFEQARGNEKRAALLTVLRKGIVLFPCILLCNAAGPNAIWWFYLAAEGLSLLLYLLLTYRPGKAADAEAGLRVYRGTMRSDITALPPLLREIGAFCEEQGASPRQQMIVNLVAEEVCSAIVREGFAGRQDGWICLILIAEPNGEFEFHIRDSADQFNPFALKETRMQNAGEEMDVSAIGIQMIRKKVKTFYYRQYQGFNTLVVRV